MSLFEELKRRNVIRVVAAYMVLSWLLLQVGDTLLGALEVPDWGLKLLVALLVLGFIPTLVFSWAYELTPEGFQKRFGRRFLRVRGAPDRAQAKRHHHRHDCAGDRGAGSGSGIC